MTSRPRRLLEIGSWASRAVPLPLLWRAGERLGRMASFALDTTALEANLARVRPDLDSQAVRRMARDGMGSYGRYWAETLRLPQLDAGTIDAGFDVDGYEHIQSARRGGHGPIMVLPHLGGWEWAAAWLGRVAEITVTAVVEPLQPPDVYDWFRALRSSYGIDVVPLGPGALGPVVAAVRKRNVVCLLADRDLSGGGVEVDFFGGRTTMPAGPALVARRTGAPMLPTAVYFEGGGRICRIRPPIFAERTASLRHDIAVTTQHLARELEVLISAAPEQWHVLQPIFQHASDTSTGP